MHLSIAQYDAVKLHQLRLCPALGIRLRRVVLHPRLVEPSRVIFRQIRQNVCVGFDRIGDGVEIPLFCEVANNDASYAFSFKRTREAAGTLPGHGVGGHPISIKRAAEGTILWAKSVSLYGVGDVGRGHEGGIA